MTLSDSVHAHCPICGNHELKRISGEYVNSMFGFVWRFLHIPAFRCEPCRYKYFSVRPLRRVEVEEVEEEAPVKLSSAKRLIQ